MKRGQVIALALAAASGLGAVVLFGRMNKPAPPPQPIVEKAPTVQVLVARADIGLGEIASESSLRWQDWPKDAVARGFITRQAKPQAIVELSGTIARVPIFAGEPINEQKLVRAGSGGVLAALLRPGMRAVSVKIKEETSAGRLILPNDYVDVVVVTKVRTRNHEEVIPETLLTSIRVLAIGQTIESREGKRSADGATATLELTPRDAELLARALNVGDVLLTLRSVADINRDVADTADKGDKSKDADSVRVIRYGVKSRSYSVN
jgi:pilus assembly protein CpaB